MNEWAFAAEVKSWWDSEFHANPNWLMARCEVEKRVAGGLERSDLSIVSGASVKLSGELRLPDHQVASPWHPDNLNDSINKAMTHGSRWAFTSDGTVFLLIDCQRTGPAITRVVGEFPLVQFHSRSELDSAAFLNLLRAAWLGLIREIAPIVSGLSVPRGMSPDELFINSLRAVLTPPVAAIREELNQRRRTDIDFGQELVTWMVDEQGWTHVPELWEEEILRAARLTAYIFTTRLVFYEALRRSKPELSPFSLPEAPARVAQATAEAFFKEARRRSGDYETLFAWDTAARFALGADAAVPLWQRVLQHLGTFDLSQIGYDVLGKMFERLIDPHERYRWGQHYTNPDVVDLMLSFALPDAEGSVLDPAVGGGTFLVRAYARKRTIAPNRSHQEVLSELFGIDVSAFAASLATVNLAVRELEFVDNYPQIANRSFFAVQPNATFMSLPSPDRVALGDTTPAPVHLGQVKAVICNPPYIRVHELGADRLNEAKNALLPPNRIPPPEKLNGLSNYHVYFWLHAAQFLEADGRLVVIAAGEWLDSDYGAALQKWLLDHFQIECILESLAEPWFSEARVGTVVVCARLCPDEEARRTNVVRFVLLRKTLRELYGQTASESEHLEMVDALKQRLCSLPGQTGESEDFDWSAVTQGELLRLGIE